MGIHTQFYHGATAARGQKLWNPSKTLEIINTDPGYECITCIGHAPSKERRCRISIIQRNRNFIMNVLDNIAYLNPDSAAVASQLQTIVGLALCVRHHQNQADTILKKWQRKLQQLGSQQAEQIPINPVQSSKKQYSTYDQSKQSRLEQLREEVAKLEEELKNQCRPKDEQEEEKHKRQRKLEKEREREAKREEKAHLEEKERLEKERKQREEKKRRERDQAAYTESVRQKVQKEREEREREAREQKLKERAEWDQSWTKYQERWVLFRASTTREGDIRDSIPWPVKSGSYRDVKASNVRQFLRFAVPTDAHMAKHMRKECQKWHPDILSRWLQGSQLTDVDRMMIDMICRIVTDLLNDCSGRSADFLS